MANPKPIHSKALDRAILIVGRFSPGRTSKGYASTLPPIAGVFDTLVNTRTAERLVGEKLATARPKLGHPDSVLRLTPRGNASFEQLKDRENGRG